jgi:predicted nucleic acid-binding Zn ribbon protein
MAAAKHQRMLERRAAMRARACAWCRKPLTVIRDDQRFCSHKCGDDWRNDQKRLANLRAKKAARTPCEVCGGRIPAERAASAIYCSVACKQLGGRSGHPAVRRDQTDYNRRYLYGITAEQFAAMLEEQNNLCAICRSPEWPGKGSRPHVDHDHATGKVRGLLCGKCNVALGNMHDDPVRLRAAAAYVEAHMA